MSDVVTKAKASAVEAVNNGGMTVLVFETGAVQTTSPEINQYVPSGTLFTRYKDRFDEYYSGPPTGP